MILDMYITTAPIILAGIVSNLFTKSKLYKRLAHPIDGGHKLKDGRPIFGANKTWVGFFAMILFCTVSQVLVGLIYNATGLTHRSDFYAWFLNTPSYNIIVGAAIGFTYSLFELPNSFIKRRVGIPAGETQKSFIGLIFCILDQIDSLIGVMFIIYILAPISFGKYLGYVALGGLTHLALNIIMIALNLRRKP